MKRFALTLCLIGISLPAMAQAIAPFGVDPMTVSETGPAPSASPQPAPFAAEMPVQTEIGITLPDPILTAQAPPQTSASGAPDETALRYFAQQGDTVRLQREIERLRALYPNWQPPADPLTTDFVPDQSIVRIWDLVTAGDYAGARAAIAEKKAADPGFVPTADLTETIERGEAGTRLRAASDASQFDEVVSIAANAPQLLTCSSVDNLWRLAEAFIKTGAQQRGSDAYSYILTNCTDPGERFATMQKAIDLLDRTALTPLLALEKDGEFSPLRLDLARRAVAAALDEGGAAPATDDVDLLAKAAMADKNAEDLRLLGYFELDRNRPTEARRFFEAANSAVPSAESAQGLGVALVQLNDPAAAEAALAEYRDDNEDIAKVYRDAAAATLAREPRLAVSETILGRIVETTIATRDAGLAQELGWYAYAFNQPQTALEWFQTALGWQADLEPAAYGLMVSANALGDTARVEEIRRTWGGRSVRIAQFGNLTSLTSPSSVVPLPKPRPAHLTQVQTVRVAQQQAPRQVQQAEASSSGGRGGGGGCQTFRPPNSLSPGGALSHAWCLMDLNRPAQAVDHFGRALDSANEATRSDAAYGRALAFIRLGLPDEAAVAAAAAPLSDKRVVELQTAILTLKATSAYNIGEYQLALAMLDARAQYAAERNDLLTLRAWSYYHLRRYAEAERIFEAVAATGYGDAVSGLDAARASLRSAQSQ
ncbi:cellulose synthase [Devosia sp.]|uniref:cellulose synthase n=1 Tax=Devosia sp. TaxID=1871048 RepID=UPI001B2BF462|nr:cellulose synthase [Devosia sp.]MBO9588934.1 cellulose synthase [Devosia sp.]